MSTVEVGKKAGNWEWTLEYLVNRFGRRVQRLKAVSNVLLCLFGKIQAVSREQLRKGQRKMGKKLNLSDPPEASFTTLFPRLVPEDVLMGEKGSEGQTRLAVSTQNS